MPIILNKIFDFIYLTTWAKKKREEKFKSIRLNVQTFDQTKQKIKINKRYVCKFLASCIRVFVTFLGWPLNKECSFLFKCLLRRNDLHRVIIRLCKHEIVKKLNFTFVGVYYWPIFHLNACFSKKKYSQAIKCMLSWILKLTWMYK